MWRGLAPRGASVRSEQCGLYLICASACELPGRQWQPRLTMTRLATPQSLPRSQAFPGLSPTFDTSKGATQHALDLGRQMAQEHSSRLTV